MPNLNDVWNKLAKRLDSRKPNKVSVLPHLGDDPTKWYDELTEHPERVPYELYKDDPRMVDYSDPSRSVKVPVPPEPTTVLEGGYLRWLCLNCGTPSVIEVEKGKQYSLTCQNCGAPASPIQIEHDVVELHYEKGEPFPTGLDSTCATVASTDAYLPGLEYESYINDVTRHLDQYKRLADAGKPRMKPVNWRI